MASIKLSRYEAEEGDLPDVCMCCGAEATERKRRRFVSHPVWVYVLMPFGFIPYAIVAAILTEHIRCYTLFCPQHKNYYLTRNLIVWGALIAIVIVIIGSGILAGLLSDRVNQSMQGFVTGAWCIMTLVLPLCWLISIPVSQETAIHPTNGESRYLTLKHVSPAFVEAVRQYRADRASVTQVEEYRPRRSPHIRKGDDDRIQPL